MIRIVTGVLLLEFIIFSLSGDELAASCELSRCAWLRAAESTAWLCSERPMMAELQKLSQSRAKPSSGNTKARTKDFLPKNLHGLSQILVVVNVGSEGKELFHRPLRTGPN